MRLFNRSVFDEFVDGTNTRSSSSDFNSLLGSAEKLVLQARVSKVSGTLPTLTVRVEHSNDGKDWVVVSTPINATSISTGTTNTIIADTGSVLFAGLVRLSVELGGTDPSASVLLMACGRAEQAGA